MAALIELLRPRRILEEAPFFYFFVQPKSLVDSSHPAQTKVPYTVTLFFLGTALGSVDSIQQAFHKDPHILDLLFVLMVMRGIDVQVVWFQS
ncbi:hypothetical protein TorRG33x02_196980 [Trema orientale]|uniref:Uncharacterized protein n=1 Tax=Trema orientale TaxID=63057 RepID=A0A2P5EG22_TREOI|nr:hypothetical protein TorRG33x02_196980 [Trema orientale]